MNYTAAKIIFISTAVLLTACGGGGGGGGKASPAKVTDGGAPTSNEVDLQTGVFSDAPVAGLRYMQGLAGGVTDADGSFSYDANSAETVKFYLGKVYVGEASGAPIVTPFDLSQPGVPANLQSGYNLTRLLITLDQSTAEGIQLSEDTQWAQGTVDFNISSGIFETDDQVQRLVDRFGKQDQLVTLEQAKTHLEANTDAQQAIAALTEQGVAALSSVTVRWNPALDEGGVLAEIKGSNGEALYLETASSGSGADYKHWLSSIFYEDGKGRYLSLKLDADGQPGIVNRNGTQYRYLNMNLFSMNDFASVDQYKPRQEAYLFQQQNYDTRIKAGTISPARDQAIQAAIAKLTRGDLKDRELQQLAVNTLALVNNVLCAGTLGSCDQMSRMAGYLALAASDASVQSTITFAYETLNDNVCVGIALTQTEEVSCGNKNALREINVYFANQAAGFKGPELIDSNIIQVKYTLYDALDNSSYEYILKTYMSYRQVIYKLDKDHYYGVVSAFEEIDKIEYLDGSASNISRGEMPQFMLDTIDDIRVFHRTYFGGVGRIFSRVAPEKIDIAFPPVEWQYGSSYVDLNSPPYRPGDTVDRQLVKADRNMTYRIDPNAKVYVPFSSELESKYFWADPRIEDPSAQIFPLIHFRLSTQLWTERCQQCRFRLND